DVAGLRREGDHDGRDPLQSGVVQLREQRDARKVLDHIAPGHSRILSAGLLTSRNGSFAFPEGVTGVSLFSRRQRRSERVLVGEWASAHSFLWRTPRSEAERELGGQAMTTGTKAG